MNLRLLGLSEYEVKAYTSLVKLGRSTASNISRHSTVSYGKIYEVLASLEMKGLVQVIPDDTKMFVATSPDNLMNLLNSKEKELSDIRKEIDTLKQFYEEQSEDVVRMAIGKRNFYKIMKDAKSARTFAYAIKYTAEYHPDFVRSSVRHKEKGIDQKVLTRYDTETKKNVDKWLKIHKNIRPIANDGVAFSINDSEVIIGLIKSNITLSIRDKAFIQVLKSMFENTYMNAGVISANNGRKPQARVRSKKR